MKKKFFYVFLVISVCLGAKIFIMKEAPVDAACVALPGYQPGMVCGVYMQTQGGAC